jgi:hypothetical protein
MVFRPAGDEGDDSMNIVGTFENSLSFITLFRQKYNNSCFLPRMRLSPFCTSVRFGIIYILPVLVYAFFFPVSGWAWEVNTHRELTEQAINIKADELNAYLINNLGLEGGLDASVKGGSPRELMMQGSDHEDNAPRYLRHFHEPITNSGLLNGTFDSSINWSLRAMGDQKWSWNDAREYYYKALTSKSKAERDEYWGKTFRALGQIMHLIQDAANPAHVRNDPHPFNEGLHDYMARKHVASYAAAGVFIPDSSSLEQPGATRPEPFSNLFDRNMYNGQNPAATLGANVGVTEFTNANFFSDDTIAGQNSPAPAHPAVSELVPATTVPYGPQYVTLPRLGSPSELGARTAKYTGNQALAKFQLANFHLDLLGHFRLDDLVYEAYSINLIPRAVGYSAAILNYFFRGDLPITRTDFEVSHDYDGSFLLDGGDFKVDVEIPQSLLFQGTVSFYYDRVDGERGLLQEQVWDGTNPYRIWMGPSFEGLTMYKPVRWYVILEGLMGPGSQESRAILGKTGLAEWVIIKPPM